MVDQLFLAGPWGCLRFVIVVFPDHTHLLFLNVGRHHGNMDTVIHLQVWAYESWDSLFPISMSPNCKFMSPKHYF